MRKNDKKQTEPTFLKIIYFDELAAQDYLDITNGGRLDWSKEDNRKRAAEILTEIEAQAQGGFNILNFIKGSLAGNVDAKASGEVSKLFDSTIKNTYAENDVVTPLVTQISWTNHLLIMSGCKSDEEREFYIRLCIKEKYSKRQLQRQLDSGYYERYMLSKDVLLPESVKRLGENPFLDSYVMEFLDLPNEYHENDLRKALIRNMKDFILELGKDFTFIDEEYKVQVGGDDFRIDLLFFHRGLQCLVAIELKIGKFKPEYVSKLDFYLEALDRQVKKENENPSVGLLLCATKNDEVVEYAMSRTMSPMLVSEYKLQLPDKKVLQKKLQELVNIPMIEE